MDWLEYVPSTHRESAYIVAMNTTAASTVPVLAVVCAATLFGVLNASAVNVVLPEIGSSLQVEAGLLGWVISLFLLVYGVAIPFYGRLAQRFGSKRLFLVGILLFGLGSLACAAAPTFETLLAARFLQGVGGAAFPGLGMAMVSASAPASRRGAALGVVAATLGAGAATGPFIGGAMADLVSWRLLFGVSGLALGVIPFAWRYLPTEKPHPRSFDGWGGLFLAVGVASALFAVSEGSRAGLTPAVLATGTLAPVAAALVLWRQRSTHPFLPAALMQSRPYIAAVSMAFCATGTYLAVLVGVPLMLSEHAGLSPLQVGLVLLPGAVTTAVSGVLAGWVVDRIGARIPTRVGALLLGLVAIALSSLPADGMLSVSAATAILALGYALLNTPIAAAIGEMVEPELLPSALSLNAMVFFIGGSFGTAVMVAISAMRSAKIAAINPMHTGVGNGFSDGFLLLVPVALACGALSTMLPPRRSSDA